MTQSRRVSGPSNPAGLQALETALERDFDRLQYPKGEWLKPRRSSTGEVVLDVLVVGAGQGGLAIASALRRERVESVLLVDRNPLDRAGPWLSFARMRTLRTPKHVTGPDLGLPNLTIQAWYEAQHGEGGWEELGLIPKETWAAYLSWYRRFLKLPVLPDTTVEALTWNEEEAAFEVGLRGSDGTAQTRLARRVVLATGIEGSGDWCVPSFIKDALPRTCYAHTRWDIDFDALAGKRVAVLGAGASAFDNASVALEHGAASVDLFFRRPKLVDINPYRWAEFVGFLKHHGDLPDADRWKFIHKIVEMGQLPPADTLARARDNAGFTLHPGAPWTQVQPAGKGLAVTTPKGTSEFDFAIIGTGFVTNLKLRPELAGFAGHIATWADRYTPPAEQTHADLLRHPYLGPAFQFTERESGAAPYLRHLYNFTFGGLVSMGMGGSSISGMKYAVPRIVAGITASLFLEDKDVHFNTLQAFDTKEF